MTFRCSQWHFLFGELSEQQFHALVTREIDLGALPGVCDQVPYDLTPKAVEQVAATVNASGLRVCSVNADVGT